jgi:hypothetical protein
MSGDGSHHGLGGMDGDRRRAQTHVGPGRLTGPYVGVLQGSPEHRIRGDEPSFSGNPGVGWVEWVEVAGIEPASYDASPGLLRAQSALSLLDPIDLTNKSM